MNSFWFVVFVAVVGGFAVTLQSQFMSVLTRDVGTLESVFITYGSGGLLIGLMMLVLRGGNLSAITHVPWYTVTSGIMGLIIVGTIGYSTSKLGLMIPLSIILAAQYLLVALVDHYGWLGAPVRLLDVTRVIGIVVMLVGVLLIVRK